MKYFSSKSCRFAEDLVISIHSNFAIVNIYNLNNFKLLNLLFWRILFSFIKLLNDQNN